MKRDLRKRMLAVRDRLSVAEREQKSAEIANRLFTLPEIMAAGVILFFASFRSEVDTTPMIRRALAQGKRIGLPKVQGRNLGLFEIREYDRDVAPGAWGIPEPSESLPLPLAQVDAVIVPGAAFDVHGSRLGYGAGFYDKLLSSFRKTTIALAFDVQIVPAVPADMHDVPVRKIVTEKRTIDVK